MISRNPRFQHVDSPAYELPFLLQTLGAPPFGTMLTEDQRNLMGAIESHARNAQETILDGIAEVGNLMTMIGDTHEVSNDGLLSLGSLLKHLAREADNLRRTQAEMRSALKSDDEMQASALSKGSKATTSK